MAGFANYDDLMNKIAAGRFYDAFFAKVSSAPEVAGVWHSLWTAAGVPAAGAAPATTPGTAYTDAAGSIFTPNQSPDTKHGVTFGGVSNQNCSLLIYDRLVAVSGLSLASTGNKTVNSTTLPRYSGTAAGGVQAWLEVTTQTATTAPIVNLSSYTNQAGTTGRAGGSLTFPAVATNVDTMIGPLPLQNGDIGIRSVEVGLNVGTAASAGVCNLVLLKPLECIPLIANQWNERDLVLQLTSLPRVQDGASLAFALMASGTASHSVWGRFKMAY